MGMRVWEKVPGTIGMVALLCLVAGGAASATAGKSAAKNASTSAHSSAHSTKAKSKKGKKSKRVRGQKAIENTRTRQIQQALIEQNYMKGEPTGKWDDATQSALRKYQADHGWQTKTVPDSRALINLGLGPSKEGLLNPETAMTSGAENAAKPAEPAPAGKSTPR